nr:hypothetical protein [Tanacetum cinerariifolium]
MIAILEKYEHNADFHQIVDFVEASHLRYALTINLTVYVFYIQQFWSTARIKTTDEGTKILATIDGKPRTISESYIRRNLKLKDEAGISSLPDEELFENLTLLGTVPLFPTMLVTMGEGSGTPTEPHHTPSPEAPQSPQHDLSSSIHPPITTATIPAVIPTDIPQLRQYTRRARIAQSLALLTVADEPASPLGDDSQGEAFPTVYGLEAEQDRANIIKTSTLPNDSTTRVTSLVADEGSMQQHLNELTNLCTRLQRQQTKIASKLTAQDLEIAGLKARIKMLEYKDRGVADPSGEDATIKGRSLETGEEAGIKRSTDKGSNDTEEMVNVLTSLDAASILTSRVQVSVPSAAEVANVSIPPAGEIPTVSVPDGSGVVPTASPIFTTATVATPYSRRKGKEKMVESETPKKKKLQEQMDGFDRSNEMIAKHLHEYEQAADELTIREKIELINELVKYQDHRSKILKYQAQQKEVSEEDLKTMMQLVPVEEVYVEALQVKHPIIDWEIHTEGKRSYWKIIRLGGSTASYQFFVDMLKHFDREDLNQLRALVKETLNIRQATSDKEKELWVELKRLYELDVEDQLWTQTQALMHDPMEWRLYDSCGVHHVLSRNQEIFMLVERDYPLRKGLAIVMIRNKLDVENYS